MIFIRAQESCSFLFPVLGFLGASLLAQGSKWEEGTDSSGFCGHGGLYAGCGLQPGSQA